MKKIMLVIVTICIYTTVFSQTSKVSIGFELVPTVTWLSGNSMIGIEDSRFSYSAGFRSDYSFNSFFSIKSGIYYERKGQRNYFHYTDEAGLIQQEKIDNYINYDYLILPILGSLQIGEKVKFYVNTGFYFGYLFSQETITEAFLDIPERIVDGIDISKKMDIGLSLGSGVIVPLNPKLLFNIGVKGDFGLINTSKVEVIDNGAIRTNSIGVQLGMMYKI